MGAEFGGGLAEDALEHAIELRERLEPDVVGDLADAAARIQELGLGVLQSDPGDVVGELKAGGFLEDFTEMKHAQRSALQLDCRAPVVV